MHPVQWVLTGGDLGESSISFFDSASGRRLEVYFNDELQTASRANTRKGMSFQ